ncbi:MAG: OsmC family protein [Tepidisphaeraceae bacterium]|jgi:putative redox protein
MVEIQIAYQGNLRCSARHVDSGVTLLTDAPKDNMGNGESFSPTDLVATALGTCMLTIMGIAARRMDVDLSGATAVVTKEMSQAPIRRIARLAVTLRVPARLTEEQRQKLQNAAMTCPVHKSLHPDVQTPINFQWA